MTNCWKTILNKGYSLILLTTLLTASCVENDRTLGEGLLPGESQITVGVHTFDVPVTNRVSDSTHAYNMFQMVVGAMTDEIYGTMICNTATQIVPSSDTLDLGDNPQLISAHLSLTIDSTYCLENSKLGIPQRINIYKLTSPLDSTVGYCNSLTQDHYDAEPVSVSAPVIYNAGTLEIELTGKFAQELLNTTTEEVEDRDLFLERIHGLYIELDTTMMEAVTGRLNMISVGASSITLNYIMNDSERGITDTDTTATFTLGNSMAFNFYSTGSRNLENLSPGTELYFEGLSGIKPHISAADLKRMIDSWIETEGLGRYHIILSRAELSLPYEMPTDYELFNRQHPGYLYAFNKDLTDYSSGYYSPLPEVYSVINKGYINRSLLKYSLDITLYAQSLINANTEDVDSSMDLWIMPMTYRTNVLDEVVYEMDNFHYRKIILNGPASERKPTLTLTYGLMER